MKNEISRGAEIYSSDVFQILAEYEISRSVRYPTPMGILVIDVTSTAQDEKALGSAARVFATALNSHLRSVDIPSINGREYRVLLPATNESGLRAVCERLLSVFRNKFDSAEGNSIAFSLYIGGASHAGGKSLSYQTLLEKGLNALKQSKLKGSNTFVILS